jgi:hypothetical protein
MEAIRQKLHEMMQNGRRSWNASDFPLATCTFDGRILTKNGSLSPKERHTAKV